MVRLPGTPGSRWSLPADRSPWAERNLEVITTERPGYGRSSRLPARGFAETADDLAAVLDHVGLDRVHILSVSGGGPHVLAFAARHPERVAAATVVLGLPFVNDDEADRMIELNRVSHCLARDGKEQALRDLYAPIAVELAFDPVKALEPMMVEVPPSDHAVMADPDWRRGFAVGIREAFAQGIDGWVDENLVFGGDWSDIDLSAIRTSLTWWHRRDDHNYPWSAAERMVGRLSTASLRDLGDAGHLVAFIHEGEILDNLLERGRADDTDRPEAVRDTGRSYPFWGRLITRSSEFRA